MSKSLPYSMKDVHYDNAKFRHRSLFKVITQTLLTSNMRRECVSCSTGKFLGLLMIFGLACLMLTHTNKAHSVSDGLAKGIGTNEEHKEVTDVGIRFKKLFRRAPRLPPRLSPDEKIIHLNFTGKLNEPNVEEQWKARQQNVKDAFTHAWSGYKKFAMGYDELMPVSRLGVDGLGGLGATVVDALDTAMIMGLDEVVSEAGSWIESHLLDRIRQKGQVNLFETTIRVLGGLLSAYHLSGGDQGVTLAQKGPKPTIYLDIAKNLADRLLSAFTSSPTAIPFSDVVLRDSSAHSAPDGLSSTSEVSTLQLEFNYLSAISGDPTYSTEGMKVLAHLKTLPKTEGLVPIYISPHSGEFSGENIRLGSRGDSYYEYLIKVWLQLRDTEDGNFTYLHDMFEEAMRGVKHMLVQKSIPSELVFVGELPVGPKGYLSPKMDHLVCSVLSQSLNFKQYLDKWRLLVLFSTEVCFLPGTLALGATKGLTKEKAMKDNLLTFEDLENLKLAEDLTKTCFEMYSVTSTGLAPEIAYFHTKDYFESGLDGGNKSSEYVNDIIIKHADRHNLLRPETVESLFVLYRITQDPKYREWGWQIFESFEKYTKVESGGYSSLDDVTTVPPPKRDKMETFFLGETLKYLYLLFGDSSVIPLDKFVFNTEAHPLPIKSS
ncbi:mannosyl-oligosaccharide 1,2-alpha-mannosidase MNS3-like [Gossypium australe]|uniref:alpha-1,2-Mannosidase n=1 Tax=Gossypium australe TaxID=47621 RepID=A0A5B6X878_9ROSI|nr:mannosyl-oligosaccharide 1,2-alpha-mannosidase MNS3-like [Gossypium australe]